MAEAVERIGVVATVTVPAADADAVFRAELADRLPEPGQERPEDTVVLLWHGRRSVPQVLPGQWLRLRGTLTSVDGVPVVHNPAYDLVAPPGRRQEHP